MQFCFGKIKLQNILAFGSLEVIPQN